MFTLPIMNRIIVNVSTIQEQRQLTCAPESRFHFRLYKKLLEIEKFTSDNVFRLNSHGNFALSHWKIAPYSRCWCLKSNNSVQMKKFDSHIGFRLIAHEKFAPNRNKLRFYIYCLTKIKLKYILKHAPVTLKDSRLHFLNARFHAQCIFETKHKQIEFKISDCIAIKLFKV